MYALCFLLGSLSGLISGCVGLGSTVLGLPGLLLLGISPDIRHAMGTILVSSPFSWWAVVNYSKKHLVDFKIGVLYSLLFAVFSFLGAKVNPSFSQKQLYLMVSCIYFCISCFFMYQYLTL